jgi:glycerophosphoryl diester phosphodiesterase
MKAVIFMKLLTSYLFNILNFFKDTFRYFRDAIAIHLFMVIFLIPVLLRWSRYLVNTSNMKFIAFETILKTWETNPLVLLNLGLCAFLLITAVYFEFFFLLTSMYFIKKKVYLRLHHLLWTTLLEMKKLRAGVFFFFLFYLCLILPFGGLATHMDILSTVKLPAFIMDFIFYNRKVLIIAWLFFYLFCLYVGIRFIFVMPEMILGNKKLRLAIRESLKITKKDFFHLIAQFFLIELSIAGVYFLITFLLIQLQRLVESHFSHWTFQSGILVMIGLQLASILNLALSMVTINYIILDYLEKEKELPNIPKWFLAAASAKMTPSISVFSIVLVTLVSGTFIGIYDANYLKKVKLSTPLLYSHRGVDNKKGVQNTIESLQFIVKEQPDFVEIDVQESKDHQFILVHDENLEKLTGKKENIKDLTIKEIKKMTIYENGQNAKIATLDEYLKAADTLQQKLMIELKIYKNFSTSLIKRFVKKYADEVVAKGHRVHSLSHPAVEEIKRLDARIYTSYIVPFNFIGPPQTSADAYTMEFSTLNSGFIAEAHKFNKQVIAWTINSNAALLRMCSLGVDGVITDSTRKIKNDLSNQQKKLAYSDKLLIYSLGLDLQ